MLTMIKGRISTRLKCTHGVTRKCGLRDEQAITARVDRFPVAHECSAQNTFVMETLINELAMRAKIEPIAYRLKLLATNAKSFALR